MQPFQHKSFQEIFPLSGKTDFTQVSAGGLSIQAVLEEVELEINRRFFDHSKLILSDAETEEWMCWESTRRKFSQILAQVG